LAAAYRGQLLRGKLLTWWLDLAMCQWKRITLYNNYNSKRHLFTVGYTNQFISALSCGHTTSRQRRVTGA